MTLLLLLVAVDGRATATARQWNFSVMLDGKNIGHHRFVLQQQGAERVLTSDAHFDVKILFFTAFRYRHHDVESWRGGCVQSLQARTTTNRKEQRVSGQVTDDGFVVSSNDAKTVLPACVMTFAYWNIDFLQQLKLLNPQTGEYLDVAVEALPAAGISVRGEPQMARRFRITARDLDIEVWYSAEDRWLGLESVVRGGRHLRYELT